MADGCRVGVDYEGEYRVDWTNSLNEGLENPIIHSTFGYAAQMVIVDPDTGDIEKVVAAHDVGRAVNPLLCEGQIEGAVHMGLGYALSEGFPCDDDGRPLNTTLRSLDIIRPKDMPAGRGDPGRVAAARTRPTASRVSARSAWCPPPVRWRQRCTSATASGATSCPWSTKPTVSGPPAGVSAWT